MSEVVLIHANENNLKYRVTMIKSVSERPLSYLLWLMVPRFYIDTSKYAEMHDMKIEALSGEQRELTRRGREKDSTVEDLRGMCSLN